MANTIKETITLSISGPNFSASLGGSATSTQIGSNYTEESGLAETAAGVPIDINGKITEGNLGYLVVRNIAAPLPTPATAADQPFIDIATDDAMANKIATIQPGKGSFIAVPGGTVALWAKGNLVDVPYVFLAIEK